MRLHKDVIAFTQKALFWLWCTIKIMTEIKMIHKKSKERHTDHSEIKYYWKVKSARPRNTNHSKILKYVRHRIQTTEIFKNKETLTLEYPKSQIFKWSAGSPSNKVFSNFRSRWHICFIRRHTIHKTDVASDIILISLVH
jgi:hypothetical protein